MNANSKLTTRSSSSKRAIAYLKIVLLVDNSQQLTSRHKQIVNLIWHTLFWYRQATSLYE